MNIKHVVIIAAARSGTKMLRNILDASNHISSYPYDANYIWTYGNYHLNHDEITPGSIKKNKKEKIRRFFDRLCEKEQTRILLEKSVPNSLRVPFVREVFPGCKIIHLFRNGMDVSADSRTCWQASAASELIQSKADRRRKIKEFPLMMAWPYMLRYVLNYAQKSIFRHDHVLSWGPFYSGMDLDIKKKSLIEVCALQWKKCIDHCCDELQHLRAGVDYINVPYEKLVLEPEKYLNRIANFIGVLDGQKIVDKGMETVSGKYIGFWEKNLSESESQAVNNIILQTQKTIQNLT